MKFWSRFYELCIKNNKKPNNVCNTLGFSTATATHWKNGTVPKADVLIIIADYFDCSVDYLLGRTDTPQIYSNNVIHTVDIKGNHNAHINLKATSNNTKSVPSSDTSELVELIESLPLLKRAEAVIYLNSLKEKWIIIQVYEYLFNFVKIKSKY